MIRTTKEILNNPHRYKVCKACAHIVKSYRKHCIECSCMDFGDEDEVVNQMEMNMDIMSEDGHSFTSISQMEWEV